MTYTEQDAHDEAAGLLALARQAYEQHVSQGKAKAESLVRDAQEEADRILREANEELKWLQDKVSEHREFESQYRTSLKNYLTELLQNFNDDEYVPASTEAPYIEVDSVIADPTPSFNFSIETEEVEAPVQEVLVEESPVEDVPSFNFGSFNAVEETVETEDVPVEEVQSVNDSFFVSTNEVEEEVRDYDQEVEEIFNNHEVEEETNDSAFESSVETAEGFDDILNGDDYNRAEENESLEDAVEEVEETEVEFEVEETPEETPSFESFVPGAGVEDSSEEPQKGGFFGRRKD